MGIGVKRPGRDADHSPLSIAEVRRVLVVGRLSARVSMKGTLRECSFTGEPFFFLEPEEIKSISLGVIRDFGGVTGPPLN
jgi:hypothetical protein